MQRDVPIDIGDWTFDRRSLREELDSPHRPVSATKETSAAFRAPNSEIEAIMQCAPGDEPDETIENRQTRREAVADVFEALTPEHRWILEAIHAERVSYRALARRLGVSPTHAHRLGREATAAVRRLLIEHPTIQERIGMTITPEVEVPYPTTWNGAALDAVISLAPIGEGVPDDIAVQLITQKIEFIRTMINSNQAVDQVLHAKMRTIGQCAADMLNNRGAWHPEEIARLLATKQHDYGEENIRSFGLVGIAVRLSDKVARLVHMLGRGAKPMNETLIDTLVDLVGYSVVAELLVADQFGLPVDEDAL